MSYNVKTVNKAEINHFTRKKGCYAEMQFFMTVCDQTITIVSYILSPIYTQARLIKLSSEHNNLFKK